MKYEDGKRSKTMTITEIIDRLNGMTERAKQRAAESAAELGHTERHDLMMARELGALRGLVEALAWDVEGAAKYGTIKRGKR
jgi:metal-dependent amidase/aminoacylase/carboxypeptidase family protein